MLAQTEMTLAPAAGAGVGKILADQLLADPEFIPLMIEAAKGGLGATRSFWCGKGAAGYLETEPDFRTRIQTFALLLAHMEGEPVKRIIHQHLGGSGQVDPLKALQESPELLEAVARTLEKAKWKTAGGERSAARAAERRAQASQAIEADARPADQGAGAF
jgi:hypothetical protein